jgi:cytosine/adenosine deaminase-related metal-dependent hydrolase
MADTETMPDTLPGAFRNSLEILQEVRRAEALLRSTFGAGCLDSHGLLARPDACSDALTAAIRGLLAAQTRLAETQWPQADYQPVRPAEADAAA